MAKKIWIGLSGLSLELKSKELTSEEKKKIHKYIDRMSGRQLRYIL